MKKMRMPKLVESLRHYDRKTLLSDLMAGLTVGLVALPLSIAFAIASGVPPQAGLYWCRRRVPDLGLIYAVLVKKREARKGDWMGNLRV